MAEEFARLGHRVLGCGRSKEKVEEMRNQFGSPHVFGAVDVADEQQVITWVKNLPEEGRAPDLLLNNAGVINRNAPLWLVGAEEFASVIQVNLQGVANMIRHFVPGMIKRGRGVVVNFSSGWGRSTAPEVAPYCATKWGIEGLTQALAQELPAGLAAIPLNPGIINTEMLQSCFGANAGSFPTADEWARRAVPFLLRLSAKDNGKAMTAPGG
jgi:NAD(P)-dependent dehydrogenase (short-subunit alcohol dehydrogenase family)